MSRNISRDEIRGAVACPKCGVRPGIPCNQDGVKARGIGRNHHDRLVAAQLKINGRGGGMVRNGAVRSRESNDVADKKTFCYRCSQNVMCSASQLHDGTWAWVCSSCQPSEELSLF